MAKSMALAFTVAVLVLSVWVGSVYAADLLPDGRRDVIATMFDYPVMTDAEVEVYFTETKARITSEGGPVLFRYPGITGISVGSDEPSGTVVQPGLLRVDMPAGTHDIQVHAEGTGDLVQASDSADLPASAHELTEAVFSADPGDEIVVRDGIYRDWRTQLTGQGTADAPIVVRPETPGSVVIHGHTSIVISGQFVVFRGFRFEQCYPSSIVRLQGANDCRVTQCHFCHCGNPQSTFSHISNVQMGCDRNRVDHCFYTGSHSMSLGQSISLEGEVGRDNRYDHNIFRDIYRYASNGQENIQLGQNQRERGHLEPRATVEYNLFNYAWGDGEIISNKSSSNLIQHNVAAHCVRSAFTLRGGNEVRFDSNVMVNNAGGLRVMGKRHTIVNNLFLDQISFGIRLETGRKDSRLNIETDGTIIANNTVIDCGNGILGMEPSEVRPHRPGDNEFSNNLITGSEGVLLQTEYFENSTVRNNLVYATGEADAGGPGPNVVQADPQLTGEGVDTRPSADSPAVDAAVPLTQVSDDRWNRARPHGDAPDIGADEVGAAEADEAVAVPEIPPEPVLDLALYMGEPIPGTESVQPLELEDETAELDATIPAECVLAWDHHPAAYDATSTFTIADANGDGYMVRWRGTQDDGMPHGKLELLQAPSGELLTVGTDLVISWRDFPRNAWQEAEEGDRPKPGDDMWWRFTLMKMQDRLIVFLEDQYAGDMQVPVLTWHEHDPSAVVQGPLNVTMAQEGSGVWKGFYACKYEYAADTPPASPGNLSAQAYGGGRVGLTWRATRARRSGWTYEVFRGTTRDFPINEDTQIAARISGGGYDDFRVEPETEYHYKVRAVNVVGLPGEAASVQVETGTGGPFYRLVPATEASIVELPMEIVQEPFEGHQYLSTPGAGSSSLDEPPEEGLAEIPLGHLEAGEYWIWALVWAPSKGADSFWVSVPGTAQERFRQWGTGVHPHWEWAPCRRDVQMDERDHVLRLKYREPTTRLAAVLVTNDADFSPSGN